MEHEHNKATSRRVFAVASTGRYSHTGGRFLFAASVDNAKNVAPLQRTGGGLFSREPSDSRVSSTAEANVVVPVARVVRVPVSRTHIASVVVPGATTNDAIGRRLRPPPFTLHHAKSDYRLRASDATSRHRREV